jgi:hypothetical protein
VGISVALMMLRGLIGCGASQTGLGGEFEVSREEVCISGGQTLLSPQGNPVFGRFRQSRCRPGRHLCDVLCELTLHLLRLLEVGNLLLEGKRGLVRLRGFVCGDDGHGRLGLIGPISKLDAGRGTGLDRLFGNIRRLYGGNILRPVRGFFFHSFPRLFGGLQFRWIKFNATENRRFQNSHSH